MAEQDEVWLKRCLELAAGGRYGASPNPMVGAVIVRDGELVGEGFHQRVGGPHAERRALEGLTPEDTRGATLYVSLEPCSHSGRTPPCVEAILEAELGRVVICHLDPNPEVAGRGIERLRAAGIAVDVGALAEEACRLNLPFVMSHLKRRPAVTLKWAMSLDGKIATRDGESQWISSPQGRDWALALREEHDAILVGSGTLLADDPRLNRRLELAPGQIVKVVLDRRLRMPADASILASGGETVVFTETLDSETRVARGQRLRERGACLVEVGELALLGVLRELSRRGVQSVLVEGGGEILEAFFKAGLFERLEVCCAPKLIGGRNAPGPLGGQGVDHLSDAAVVESLDARSVGPDVVLSGWRKGVVQALLPALLPNEAAEGRAS